MPRKDEEKEQQFQKETQPLADDQIITERKLPRRSFLALAGTIAAGTLAVFSATTGSAQQQQDPDKAKEKPSDPDKEKSKASDPDKAKTSKASDPDKTKKKTKKTTKSKASDPDKAKSSDPDKTKKPASSDPDKGK